MMLCQILQTDDLSAVKAWLVNGSDRGKYNFPLTSLHTEWMSTQTRTVIQWTSSKVDSSWLIWKFHRLFMLLEAKINFEKRFASRSLLRSISLLRVCLHRAKATSDKMLIFFIDVSYRRLEFTCLTMIPKQNRKTSRLRSLLWETRPIDTQYILLFFGWSPSFSGQNKICKLINRKRELTVLFPSTIEDRGKTMFLFRVSGTS